MPNGGWNRRIRILLKASPEKCVQDQAWRGYNRSEELRFGIDLLPKNEPKPHRKNRKMQIMLRASFNKRHPMDVGTINWNRKVCISPRASPGFFFDSHRCAPNSSIWLEELLTYTFHHSPEPHEMKFPMHRGARGRGVVYVYCKQVLMPTYTSRKATH